MTDEKPKNEGDWLIIKPELLAAPEAQRSGVIGDNGNQARWEKAQEVHNLGDNSATGLFYPPGTAPATEKFGIVGLDDKAPKKNANGTPYTVYTQEAGQALTPIGQIHKPLTEGAHQSAVKLNVGITQVPEVTTGVTPQGALKYTSTVMEAGAQAVRQTEEHLAKPGAVNRDLLDMALAGSKLPGYLTNTEQLQKDVKGLVTGAAQKVEEVVQAIDKPMTPEQRAKMAGTMLPLFFFEGANKPIDKKVVQQMKLEQMTEEELKALGIERKVLETGVDAAGKALKFSEESGIELATARPGQDGLWKEVPMVRGNEVHVGLRENLPSGTKTIDRVQVKDGVVESIKSIDPRSPSYESPTGFESKITDYLHKLEIYKGQNKSRQGFKMLEKQIEEKLLHLGIPDGSLNEAQIAVLNKIGKQVMQYNANLRFGEMPIKIKVTVLK